jgi:hypothetical protein
MFVILNINGIVFLKMRKRFNYLSKTYQNSMFYDKIILEL